LPPPDPGEYVTTIWYQLSAVQSLKVHVETLSVSLVVRVKEVELAPGTTSKLHTGV
jgi:hypothetical protein